jgi:hypothetical protein
LPSSKVAVQGCAVATIYASFKGSLKLDLSIHTMTFAAPLRQNALLRLRAICCWSEPVSFVAAARSSKPFEMYTIVLELSYKAGKCGCK